MILESAQMLCTALHENGLDNNLIPYKSTHVHHPCTKWVMESRKNFMYLYHLMQQLNNEFIYRYRKRSNHLSWTKCMLLEQYSEVLPDKGLTTFAQAMPEEYKTTSEKDIDIAIAYRRYFLGEKTDLFKWTRRNTPYWVLEQERKVSP
jgi:hypothetical protein